MFQKTEADESHDIILNENPVPIRDRLPGLAREIATIFDQSLISC